MGDAIQVQQVLINLVRNGFDALAATETHDRTVVMKTSWGAPGAVEIDVIDNGEGIPGDRLGRVFDAYFSTRAEGMGMGLAISRRIAEAHRGNLTVESEPGVRTTFRLILPCAGEGDDAGTHGLRR
jgi:two-component system sensor kinase FixL